MSHCCLMLDNKVAQNKARLILTFGTLSDKCEGRLQAIALYYEETLRASI